MVHITPSKMSYDMDVVVASRTVGADELAKRHPMGCDKWITFEEERHIYTITHKDGTQEYVGGDNPLKSTSNHVGSTFSSQPFDGAAIIKKNWQNWRKQGPRGEYGRYFIPYELGQCSEADVEQAILASWASASPLGTEVHRCLELLMNEHCDDWRAHSAVRDDALPEIHTELEQFDAFAQTDPFAQTMTPIRTELSVAWFDPTTTKLVTAGQIDLLAVDDDGNYWIVDYKRVKSKKLLTQYEKSYGRTGEAPEVQHLPKTDFYKYALQVWAYALMLEQSCSISVVGCKLLRVHSDRPTYQLVACPDLRTEARGMLTRVAT